MNRSDRRRCLFFHVPRTGGSSIASLDWWDEWTGHFPSAREVGELEGWFSFAFVRNPWDRFVSLYHYFAGMTPRHRWYGPNARIVAHVKKCGSFAEFCRRFPAWPLRNHFHFWPQCRWIADAGGKPRVDFVGRFERLQHDFAGVCARLGLREQELPRLNGSRHGPYRDYYDDQTRAIVANLARSDIEAFGYTFDNESLAPIPLN